MSDVQMFWSLCGESVEFLSQGRSGVFMENRHVEGQTEKQELYPGKRSDRVLTAWYLLGWAGSEEFRGGVKHDLVYGL